MAVGSLQLWDQSPDSRKSDSTWKTFSEATCLSSDKNCGNETRVELSYSAWCWPLIEFYRQSFSSPTFLVPSTRHLFIPTMHNKQGGRPPPVTTLFRYIATAQDVLHNDPDMGPKMQSNYIIETVLCRLGNTVMIKVGDTVPGIFWHSSSFQPQCNAYVIVLGLICMFSPIPMSLVYLS